MRKRQTRTSDIFLLSISRFRFEIAHASRALIGLAAAVALFAAEAGRADPVSDPAPAPAAIAWEAGAVGPYTKLPLPRFASLKADLVYMRQGPSTRHAILLELTRKGLPVEIIGEHHHWLRVILPDGRRGWIHRAMLSGRRMAVARDGDVVIRERPLATGVPVATLTPATPMSLGTCGLNWCLVEGHGARGYLPKAALWGVRADEIID